ncbi:MAG: PDZ domain-containing protein [Rhodothermales bacterium]
MMSLLGLTLAHAVLLAHTVCAGEPTPSVEYELRFDRIEHHEADVRATFSGLDAGKPVELRMSRTSPGRYAMHEFAKNVYDVVATDEAGRTLRIERPNPYQWNVVGHSGTVHVRYTLFADRADGTYSSLDRTHAHLNMPATILWARNMDAAPIRIRFVRPHPEWTIATQLVPTNDPETFTAPDLAYLLDSPTEMAALEWHTWTVDDGTRQSEHRIALHHTGSVQEGEAFARNVRAIVDAQWNVFGELPAHDFGTYTFIVCYMPHAVGDGMEHRNSTVVTNPNPLTPDGLSNLGTMSHEYFHQWNVERIRPADLEPFDFEAENMTDLLWFAEGFTSYYTGLSIHRAGLTSVADYAASLSGTVNAVVNLPGRAHRSLVEMSQYATFADQGSFLDPMNTANTFISYYTWGSAIGLALDVTLRTEFDTSVDVLMQRMWERYGQAEVPYTLEDLEHVLGEVAGDRGFATTFMDRYVRGHGVPDYAELLARMGLQLESAHPGPGLMAALVPASDGILVAAALEGTPLFRAGVSPGDRITHVDGRPVSHPEYLEAWVARLAPGDGIPVTVNSRGVVFQTDIVVAEDPAVRVVVDPDADATALAYRDAWLWGPRLKR